MPSHPIRLTVCGALVYTVYAMCHSLRDRGAILAYAGTTAERAQETLDVMLAELKGLYNGITADEIDRLKGQELRRVRIVSGAPQLFQRALGDDSRQHGGERRTWYRALLLPRHRVRHDEARVIVHECRQVDPLMAPQ